MVCCWQIEPKMRLVLTDTSANWKIKMNAVRQQGAFKTLWTDGKKAQKLEYSQNEKQCIIDISLTRSQQSDSDRVHSSGRYTRSDWSSGESGGASAAGSDSNFAFSPSFNSHFAPAAPHIISIHLSLSRRILSSRRNHAADFCKFPSATGLLPLFTSARLFRSHTSLLARPGQNTGGACLQSRRQ